jgi:hypothetical protein
LTSICCIFTSICCLSPASAAISQHLLHFHQHLLVELALIGHDKVEGADRQVEVWTDGKGRSSLHAGFPEASRRTPCWLDKVSNRLNVYDALISPMTPDACDRVGRHDISFHLPG